MQPFILLLSAAPIGPMADAGGWDHMDGTWGWGMAVFGTLFMALIITLIAGLFRTLPRHEPPVHTPEPSALDILDRRFASGEIDRDEYLERRSGLQTRT